MQAFKKTQPSEFHKTIHKSVHTMAISQKHIKVSDTKVIDVEMIYARAKGLQSSGQECDTQKLLSYELAPQPTSMFDEEGNMRGEKAKYKLKHALKNEISRRHLKVNAVFLDGCAVLWTVY